MTSQRSLPAFFLTVKSTLEASPSQRKTSDIRLNASRPVPNPCLPFFSFFHPIFQESIPTLWKASTSAFCLLTSYQPSTRSRGTQRLINCKSLGFITNHMLDLWIPFRQATVCEGCGRIFADCRHEHSCSPRPGCVMCPFLYTTYTIDCWCDNSDYTVHTSNLPTAQPYLGSCLMTAPC